MFAESTLVSIWTGHSGPAHGDKRGSEPRYILKMLISRRVTRRGREIMDYSARAHTHTALASVRKVVVLFVILTTKHLFQAATTLDDGKRWRVATTKRRKCNLKERSFEGGQHDKFRPNLSPRFGFPLRR
ncbi:hypothetical protein LX36DRAFT_660846 [Colletotrichum falcatum]|nr:hypothetical protein LX36DRAFT_660846 [Colletotrichum falcatum]